MRIALLLSIALLGASCFGGDDRVAEWPNWRVAPDTALWRSLLPDRSTCYDCLTLEEALVIAPDSGPGFYEDSQFVTQDSLGRFWVYTNGGQKVYDSTGAFVTKVGQTGEGPLEFRGVGPIYTDPDGFVHVFDQHNGRETVIAPDFTLASTRPLPWGPVYDAALLGRGSRLLLNGVFGAQPEQLGLPLHIVDSAGIVTSFGVVAQGAHQLGTMHLLRKVAVGPDALIYAAGFFEYAVDVWSERGERVLGFKRTGLWSPPPDGQPQPLTRETELWGLILDVAVDESGYLWVVSWAPRDDWRDNTTVATAPNGVTFLRPTNSNWSLYRTVIEIIDLSEGRIRYHGESDELIYGILRPGRLFGTRITNSGEPQLVIWNAQVRDAAR